ncbi:MAG: lysylphosphatidylglycerol synthase transmembrane domain-containing protein [Bacteroidetes bacterium]|nr:lysylphosphatidylglycerol synthase transmembrane domain-containing protein [Bacteroidota bacterium]
MSSEGDIKKIFNYKKLLIPVIIGLLASVALIIYQINKTTFVEVAPGKGQYVWEDKNNDQIKQTEEYVPSTSTAANFNTETFTESIAAIEWSSHSAMWLGIALLAVVIRDFGYIWRLRILSEKKISWRASFDVIMIWELASCVAPSAAGGSKVAMFIINREGINLGKSTALVMVTAFLDELFYILIVPIMFIILGTTQILPASFNDILKTNQFIIFLIAYIGLVILTIVLFFGIFKKPHLLKKGLSKIVFQFKFLKRFRRAAIRTGNEMVIASQELKEQPFSYYFKAFGASTLSWTARFMVVNFIMMAFLPNIDNVLIFCRQLILWVLMLIPVTPGASGISEFLFTGIMGDITHSGGLILVITLLWRFLSYYPYLFVGLLVLPGWIKRTSKN